MDLLKLVAFDEEDLAVVSAHLQDAALRAEDLAFLPKEKRFALCARRFDWESDPAEPPRRRLTGVHFERVTSVRCKNIDPKLREGVMNLLAVTFEPTSAPSGVVTLIFSEDRAIRLEVECIEAQMKDMGPVWEVDSRPAHDDAPAAAVEPPRLGDPG